MQDAQHFDILPSGPVIYDVTFGEIFTNRLPKFVLHRTKQRIIRRVRKMTMKLDLIAIGLTLSPVLGSVLVYFEEIRCSSSGEAITSAHRPCS